MGLRSQLYGAAVSSQIVRNIGHAILSSVGFVFWGVADSFITMKNSKNLPENVTQEKLLQLHA